MPIGDTNLTATKQTLVASVVQRELIAAMKVKPTIRDLSAFAVKGASTVSFPRAGSFSVEDRATTAQATLANVTYATDSIALSRMATVGYVVDPQDDLESAINVELDLASRAAKALGLDVDTQIIAGFEADGTATTTAGAISQAIVLEMRQTLLEAEADPSKLWLAVGPDAESTLLGIAEFVDADKYGRGITENGEIGKLYGVRVVMTSGIGANTFYMYETDGYGIAFQKGLSMGSRPAPEYGSTAVLRTWDQKFGTDQLQNGSLVLKDNN